MGSKFSEMQLGLVIRCFWIKKKKNIMKKVTMMESKMTKLNTPDKTLIKQGKNRTDPP